MYEDDNTTVLSKKGSVKDTKCPYNCVNGKLFNPFTKTMQTCSHCSEIRKKALSDSLTLVGNTDIYKKLGIPKPLKDFEFDINVLISSKSQKMMESDSIIEVDNKVKELLSDLGIGVLPNDSILFNFGSKANTMEFISCFLTKAYRVGFKVAPLIAPYRIAELRSKIESTDYKYIEDDEFGNNFKDYLSAEVVLVHIDTGVTQAGLDSIRGLMQLRANNSLPTIIVTDYWSNKLACLKQESISNFSYYLAKTYSIQYKEKYLNNISVNTEDNQKPSVVNKTSSSISTEEFNAMLTSNKNLL